MSGSPTHKSISIGVPSGAFIWIDNGMRLSIMAEVVRADRSLARDGNGVARVKSLQCWMWESAKWKGAMSDEG